MSKKLVLTCAAIISVVAGVVGLSAFEAHIINVTAHIENALAVTPTAIEFGTVFPQEFLVRGPIEVSLSSSFMDQNRVDEVTYKLVQKPKPLPLASGAIVETTLASAYAVGSTSITVNSTANMSAGQDIAIGYLLPGMERNLIASIGGNTINLTTALANNHAAGEKVVVVYQDLCPFLSKNPTQELPGVVGVPSYFNPGPPAFCEAPASEIGLGRLDKSEGIITNNWMVDLKVPPVAGTADQAWPVSCANFVVPTSGTDYGCDLWFEVTGIHGGAPEPTPTPTLTPTPTPTPTPINDENQE